MALIAPVVDGKIQETAAQKNTASAAEEENNSLGKDAFLQLLVAQMKYQDPLEPTSNTEYISQLATFSELEQMQNLSSSMDLQRASQLVGKQVYLKTTTENGTGYVQGRVDYVVMENNKAYLSIEEQLYPLSELDTVLDEDYQDAVDVATEFAKKMNKLTEYDKLTLDDKEDVTKLKESYDGMTKYQKTFVATDYVKKLDKYVTRMEELQKTADDKQAASDFTKEFNKQMDKLPELEDLTLENKEAVMSLKDAYDKLTDDQKERIDKDDVDKLDEYVEKIGELEKEK